MQDLSITCLRRIRFSLTSASRKESEMDRDKNEGHKEENEGEMKDTLHSIRGWASYIMSDPIECSENVTWYAKWAGSVSFRMQTSGLHSSRRWRLSQGSIFQTAQHSAHREHSCWLSIHQQEILRKIKYIHVAIVESDGWQGKMGINLSAPLLRPAQTALQNALRSNNQVRHFIEAQFIA